MKSGLALVAALAMAAGQATAGCSESRVDLRGSHASVRFTVEIADDRQERSSGLMNRERLASSAGMLFVYDHPQPVGFWMRNTLIPLDMIFAGADGVVRKVHENAVPKDETVILGGDAIQYVLEINGGMAGALGIGPGSQLRSPLIDPALAAWPCDGS